MASELDGPAKALALIRSWDWLNFAAVGALSPPGRELAEVVNRLAMEGIERAESKVLTLLCRGDLCARADYTWKKFQIGNKYYHDGTREILSNARWQRLAHSIHESVERFEIFEPEIINLNRLELEGCDFYVWNFQSSSFSTAYTPQGVDEWDLKYFEEFFSAWNVEIWPCHVELDRSSPNSTEQLTPEASAPAENKGGRPPTADWVEAALAMAGEFYSGDWKPKRIADVERRLGDWLASRDEHPGTSTIRTYARRIFRAIEDWQRPD